MAGHEMTLSATDIRISANEALRECDLCGSAESHEIADSSSLRNRTVVCLRCGLIYASPQESEIALETLYDESFDADPGSKSRVGLGLPKDIETQENQAADWGLQIVKRFIDLRGGRILDLRCQSGALSAALVAEGADVLVVDPFEANVAYCTRIRGLSKVSLLPFTRFSNVVADCEHQFDAVTILSEHVLAHVLSPRKVLNRILYLLKPGGYLFLVEKDVLHPSWSSSYNIQFVLDSGRAHQYHLTSQTLAHYLHSVGFDVLECRLDEQRVSAYRYVRAISRKPFKGVSGRPYHISNDGSTARAVRRRIRLLQLTYHLHRSRLQLELNARGMLRKVPGLKPTWHVVKSILGH